MQTNRQTGIYQRDELTTKVYYIALDGETTNLNEFTNFCGVLLLIQQFVNSIKFVVLSPLRYESGRAERPRLSVIIIFVVSLIRLTDKQEFISCKGKHRRLWRLAVATQPPIAAHQSEPCNT